MATMTWPFPFMEVIRATSGPYEGDTESNGSRSEPSEERPKPSWMFFLLAPGCGQTF